MLILSLTALTLSASISQPPAAATQPSPPLLSGPAASEDKPARPTLVQRTFDGKIEDVGGEPDVVAIGLLDLTPEQRLKYDEINAARMTAFDRLVRDNYGLILEVGTLQSSNNAAQRMDLLGRVATAFKPYADRGSFFQEIWPFLTDEQRRTTQAMVDEYRQARTQSLRDEMTEKTSMRSLAARQRLETLGMMVRQSIERQIGLERDNFEMLASDLELTPEQRNAAEAIFQPLAIKRFQNIPVTREEQAAAFAEFNKLLTAGQKQKVLGILLRQYQNPKDQPPATSQPAAPPAGGSHSYKLEAGPFEVMQRLLTFTDDSRLRDVPLTAYLPKREKPSSDPVLIISPGWGGGRDGYRYLAQHWAGHGYAVFVLEHEGSDVDVVKKAVGDGGAGASLRVTSAMRQSLNDPANWSNRALDVTFVLDELTRRSELTADDLSGRLDLSRVGMSGHSFGAYTTMLIMGAVVDLPGQDDRDFRDGRCVAGIAMSSQGEGRLGLDQDSWSNVAAPMLYLTGTRDFEIGSRDVAGRRVAFDRTREETADDQMLITIADAEHLAFSDNQRALSGEAMKRDPRHHQWILMATTAFWDSHLRNDAAAAAWLHSDALATLSSGACPIERK